MKKIILILPLALAVFASGCQKKTESTSEQKPVVKIGIVGPLSGNLAFVGESAKKMVAMAQEKIPPDSKFCYEFLFEDDQMTPQKSILAAQKLIQVNKVDAILSFWFCSIPLSEITSKNKVVHIALTYDAVAADGKFNFVNHTPPHELARALAEELSKEKTQTVGIICFNTTGMNLIKDHLMKELVQRKIQSRLETYNFGERDFKTMIAKLNEFNPDKYILLSNTPEIDLIVKQMREAKVDLKKITTIGGFDEIADKAQLEGNKYVAVGVANPEFKIEFNKKYPDGFINVGAPFIYDTVQMLVHVYESSDSSNKPSSSEIAQRLLQIKKFDGIVGKITCDDQGHFQSKAVLKKIENGKPVVIKKDL